MFFCGWIRVLCLQNAFVLASVEATCSRLCADQAHILQLYRVYMWIVSYCSCPWCSFSILLPVCCHLSNPLLMQHSCRCWSPCSRVSSHYVHYCCILFPLISSAIMHLWPGAVFHVVLKWCYSLDSIITLWTAKVCLGGWRSSCVFYLTAVFCQVFECETLRNDSFVIRVVICSDFISDVAQQT